MARIDYYGTDDIVKKLEKLKVNTTQALAQALKESAEVPKREMLDYIKQHRKTGKTEESFTETIKTENDVIYLELGFNLSGANKPGLPALFLNYGTPFIEPSFFIDKAIENNTDKIKQTQQKTLERIAKENNL